jgi:hypothetical protein
MNTPDSSAPKYSVGQIVTLKEEANNFFFIYKVERKIQKRFLRPPVISWLYYAKPILPTEEEFHPMVGIRCDRMVSETSITGIFVVVIEI